jgi:hypothetical protein
MATSPDRLRFVLAAEPPVARRVAGGSGVETALPVEIPAVPEDPAQAPDAGDGAEAVPTAPAPEAAPLALTAPAAPVEAVPPPAPVQQPLAPAPIPPVSSDARVVPNPVLVDDAGGQSPVPALWLRQRRREASSPAPTRSGTVVALDEGSEFTQAKAVVRRSRGVYVVHPGDSLWSIAARLLASRASATAVARKVARLWRLNRARIGTGDPDVLPVGVRLRLTRSVSASDFATTAYR